MEQIFIPTAHNEELEARLRAIADTLEVPDSAYEQATERYEAVGRWLCADGSPLKEYNPRIYAQGSFALGTVIRPFNRTDYDIDAVVQLDGDLDIWTPRALKSALGDRLRAHGKYTEMLGPEGRRCWTLTYASGDQEPGFHMDLLASTGHRAGDLLVIAGMPTAIAITNRVTPGVYDWRQSDPKGYAAWFKKRMEQELKRVLAEKRAVIETVPEYAVRTSLQITVQLLKRHRDVMFQGREEAPISVIISTLAARAYKGDASLADTVVNVTKGMRAEIEWEGDRPIIRNPVRAEENFADRWDAEPGKRAAFFRWLDAVEVFVDEVEHASSDDLRRPLAVALGESMADTAIRKYASHRHSGIVRAMVDAAPAAAPGTPIAIAPVTASLPAAWESASHRERLRWAEAYDGTRLRIRGRVTGGQGARIGPLHSGQVLAPRRELGFEAVFDEQPGDSVFWQVVNTGAEARNRGQLRGSFEAGTRFKDETALYRGDHFIEAFLIRGGVCVARSGPFAVSVR